MIQTKCAICSSFQDFKILYKKNFSEKVFNKNIFSARRLPDGSHYQMVVCRKDGLVRSNPILESETIEKLYKESSFTYEEEVKNLEITYLRALKPILEILSKDDSILEIGCGNGFLLKSLYDLGFKNCFGIEPSEEAVDKSDNEIKKNIIVSILKPNLFKSKKFKFIYFFQTLDHIVDPNSFLTECARLLDEGGYILAFNHDIDSLSSKVLGERSPIIDIEHTFLYNKNTIKLLFKKNGFNIINVYSPMNTLSLKHLIWLLPFPRIVKRILSSIEFLKNFSINLNIGNLCIVAQKK